MRRYNQRLFRLARSVVKDDVEAEDIVQQAYLDAYAGLASFRQEASFATWITRIALYAAWSRSRKQRREEEYVANESVLQRPTQPSEPTPEQKMTRQQLNAHLEAAIDALPESLRTPIVLRDIEGMSTRETATVLDLSEANLRVRIHRGRAMLKTLLYEQVQEAASDVFGFAGTRCDRIVRQVMTRLLAF
jgi:RNA polymerase sigma-70 factor (ECF subfamily)